MLGADAECTLFEKPAGFELMTWRRRRRMSRLRFFGVLALLILYQFPVLAEETNGDHDHSMIKYLLIGVVGLLGILVGLVLILICVCMRRPVEKSGVGTSGLLPNSRNPPRSGGISALAAPSASSTGTMSQFSPRVLARSRLTSAASDFSLVIGSGAKSIVYKGFMDGNPVAIKLLSKPVKEENFQVLQDFWRLDHPNVVKLFAICNDGMQALVYEFVPNNTLRFHLQGEQTNSRVLSWAMRMNILLGTAKGIHYLHNQAWMRIIHGSITSSNIMLDMSCIPKLSDVGVSQLLLKDVPMDSLVGSEYLDQEFFNGGILTTESDVYSFGVIVLETISGRGPRVPRPGQTAVTDSILIWVEKQLNSRNLRDLVDKRCPDVDQIRPETVGEIVTLAMRCCDKSRVRRPSINVVIETIENIHNEDL